jgi:hypothetical protein
MADVDNEDKDDDDDEPTGEPFECKLLDGGECPLPLLESLTGGVKFCGFRLQRTKSTTPM